MWRLKLIRQNIENILSAMVEYLSKEKKNPNVRFFTAYKVFISIFLFCIYIYIFFFFIMYIIERTNQRTIEWWSNEQTNKRNKITKYYLFTCNNKISTIVYGAKVCDDEKNVPIVFIPNENISTEIETGSNQWFEQQNLFIIRHIRAFGLIWFALCFVGEVPAKETF